MDSWIQQCGDIGDLDKRRFKTMVKYEKSDWRGFKRIGKERFTVHLWRCFAPKSRKIYSSFSKCLGSKVLFMHMENYIRHKYSLVSIITAVLS